MLDKLIINNVALIKHLELDFSARLNILSGETGAGKSIIVDSLMLLLGGRYDKSILRYGEEKGFVEGIFTINDAAVMILDEYGFEREDSLIVNRKFMSDGRNEIRINGRAASISMLRSVMSVLVDIYGQNEYQSLSKASEHLRIINYFVRKEADEINKSLFEEFNNFQKINKELSVIGSVSERERNIDMLKYQINEILRAKTFEGEEEKLAGQRKVFMSAEILSESLNAVKQNLLFGEDITARGLIDSALSSFRGASGLATEYSELYERLNSVSIEVEDIAQTASGLMDELEFDPAELERIESRLDLLRSLKRKYGSAGEMKKFLAESQEFLKRLENSAEDYERLQKQKLLGAKRLYELSLKLSKIRKDGAVKFEKLIESELADLGMKGARFEIVFSDLPSFEDSLERFTAAGLDKAEFYLSANTGLPPQPLIKIISGGEMSRFILALKVISSRIDDIPTMIFDEIDTGISGKIGQEVAKKLAVISRSHQVLCVTHLAQIASMADSHFYISKSSTSDSTVTDVILLENDDVIEEISRLSGAKDISEQSNLNARGMKEWSNTFKDGLN